MARSKAPREFIVTISPGDAVNADDIFEMIYQVTSSRVAVTEVRRRRVVAIEPVADAVTR
jgi:hypothetical protein